MAFRDVLASNEMWKARTLKGKIERERKSERGREPRMRQQNAAQPEPSQEESPSEEEQELERPQRNVNNVVCALLAANEEPDAEELVEKAQEPGYLAVEQAVVYKIDGMPGLKEPKTFKEAMRGAYKAKWLEAIDAEYDALFANGTFDLVIPSEDTIVLRTKWVFKVKTRIKTSWNVSRRGFASKDRSREKASITA